MVSEHPDSETALLKALADVNEFKKQFKKEVHSLKTQYGKLANRVQTLVDSDFQGQLNDFNKRITELSNELTKTINQQSQELLVLQRIVCILRIDSLSCTYLEIMVHQLPNKEHLQTQLYTDAASTKTAITTSDNPHEPSIKFKNKWDKILEDLGVETITF